jgi:ABC-2 type transport system ATP-binding protein
MTIAPESISELLPSLAGLPSTAIETHQLRKSFRSRGKVVEAVQGVDLHVESGEIFGFLGPNGAGKTTTLRMLATLLPPSGGSAIVAGCDLLGEPQRVRERIGYVSQAGGADERATGRENLILQARLYGLNKKTAIGRANASIAALNLESFADRLAKTYSGGQRRRLDLALGLVHRPQLVFLDEPSTGLDPQSRARLWDEIRRLREGGMTMFLTTHYMDEADALCDRIGIIDYGRIVALGTPDELKHEIAGDVVAIGLDPLDESRSRASDLLKSLPFVRRIEALDDGLRLYVDRGEAALPVILRTLDGAGVELRTLSLARPSLDDVFLEHTGRSLREDSETEGRGSRWH